MEVGPRAKVLCDLDLCWAQILDIFRSGVISRAVHIGKASGARIQYKPWLTSLAPSGLVDTSSIFAPMEIVMRHYFPNSTRPKKAAKTIASLTRRPLSNCQRAIAIACGYRDWHEMESSYSREKASVSDEKLPRDVFVEQQIAIASLLGEEIGINIGDAQYLLSRSRLTGNRQPNMRELLDIRIGLFRKNELPIAARRLPGAVGKLKSPGRNGEVVILRKFGRPTSVITDKSANAMVADFEYVTPRKPASLFIPMRLYLAYGLWFEADGATVLFSRDYCPLWRIRKDTKPERLDPWQKIKFVDQRWFWGDENTPWSDPRRYQTEMERLDQFGLGGLPRLVEVLPIVVFHDDVHDFINAVDVLKSRAVDSSAA